MHHKPLNIVLLFALALAFAPIAGVRGRAQPEAEGLMGRVGERVAEFYNRGKNVICIETSTVQPVNSNNSPEGFARTVESELHIEAEGDQGSGEPSVVRKILKVNGRAPREKDSKDRAGCTDPNPLSSEPLAFLLPAHRAEYQFRSAGVERDRTHTALLIDFASVDRRSNPRLIEDPGGHDDCFDWTGHTALRGRIWVNAGTYDVTRIERGLPGPVEITVPALLQRRYHLENWVSLVRDDTSIRYRTVAFSDPDEVLLLPESIESFIVVRGGLQSTRQHQSFSGYKRFVAQGRILP